MVPPVAKNLMEKFATRFVSDGDCWRWTGAMALTGYGTVGHLGKNLLAHRVSYHLFRGPITNQTLDHLCRNRWCVNPNHLEPVSIGENVKRGALSRSGKCKRGHIRTKENTARHASGQIAYCRVCYNDLRRERYRTDSKYREREQLRARSVDSRPKTTTAK